MQDSMTQYVFEFSNVLFLIFLTFLQYEFQLLCSLRPNHRNAVLDSALIPRGVTGPQRAALKNAVDVWSVRSENNRRVRHERAVRDANRGAARSARDAARGSEQGV